MANKKRFNRFAADPEFTPLFPNGEPQLSLRDGVPMRAWLEKKIGERRSRQGERYGFAQLYVTPKGRVGHYAGNMLNNGAWSVRLKWTEENDQDAAWFRHDDLKPIYVLKGGERLPLLWRPLDENRPPRFLPRKVVLQMKAKPLPRPKAGTRVVHKLDGPGVVVRIDGVNERWYAIVLLDCDVAEAKEDGEQPEPREYGMDGYYDVFDVEMPVPELEIGARITGGRDRRTINEKFTLHPGASGKAATEKRARAGKDAYVIIRRKEDRKGSPGEPDMFRTASNRVKKQKKGNYINK
jgi:hypothetical protein